MCSWCGSEYLLSCRHNLLPNRPQRVWYLLLWELVGLCSWAPPSGRLSAWDHAMRFGAGGRLLYQRHGLLARRLPGRPAPAFSDRRLIDARGHRDIRSDRHFDVQTRRSGSSKQRCSLDEHAALRHDCYVGSSLGSGRPFVSVGEDPSTIFSWLSATNQIECRRAQVAGRQIAVNSTPTAYFIATTAYF